MQRHTFGAQGRGHRILSALRHGPAYRSELVLDDPKAGYALHSLMRLGMIKPGAGRYMITPLGVDALRDLDSGQAVTAYEGGGNARVFARAGVA